MTVAAASIRAAFLATAAWAAAIGIAREARAQANPNLPLDRPATLRDPVPLGLEAESGRMIRGGGPFSFIFPRPCRSTVDSSVACGGPHGLGYADSAKGNRISFSPEAGYEYRYLDENVHAAEFGTLLTGNRGPLSFGLDLRMYTEFHEDFHHASYDREFVERQAEESSGSVAYSSYSRYRADLDYDLPWGRFSMGRDLVHWGPGLYENLVLNRDGLPFNQVSFATSVGPFRVITLYGQMAARGDRFYAEEASVRSLYAHRYEWSVTPDWLLGVSEQLIVYGYEEPFAFVPIIPLFIFKGDSWEHLNNGNLAVDLNWRFAPWARAYVEFLLDDLTSPTALFDDQWSNKWAVMGGVHAVARAHGIELGAVAEGSRVEPWVYTHYEPRTAQAANEGYPLGNPHGPNSLSLATLAYARAAGATLSGGLSLEWKGTDPGSAIDDVWREGMQRKTFLKGVDAPGAAWRMEGSLPWGRATVSAGFSVGREERARASLFYRL